MPKPLKKDKIAGKYFLWRLGRRNGIYSADGRSNKIDVGRHSLGTDDRDQALRVLERVDLNLAVQHGLAEASALRTCEGEPVPLEEGRDLYLAFARRARVTDGARPVSVKRYRAVFDKFLPFARRRGLDSWNQVTAKTLTTYASYLESQDYAYRTLYLELTTLKQLVKWLVEEGRLPASARINMRLEKPEGTDTYCWRAEEVTAMIAQCRAQPGQVWLANVIQTLALTGLRISELRDLRWSDVDLANRLIRFTDESSRRKKAGSAVRTTKSGRDRSFPIHEDLVSVLEGLPRHADGHVFHSAGGARLKADRVRRALIRDAITPLLERFASSEDEIGFKDGRLRSFRHFFCSLCANSNVPERTVMLWLGHADSDMVRHYYHLHDSEARRHMSRLSLTPAADAAGVENVTHPNQ
ncbi:MAG: site-specific integrase [Planctomycetota bacterium]|nr:tyrosine-type recombinase/integrase [Planctomycetaceae bacterium]MDQ3332397.1 site-specific integrase [Planctomycetota bacterium]